MTWWCAIRTKPGYQMPQRDYTAEDTRSAKGYRIITSLDANVSAVERSLAKAGHRFYMPAEFKVFRNRQKTNTYELRRFALLPGYVFVYDVSDFEALRKLPGVAGLVVNIIGDLRVPLKIPVLDIIKLRTIEAKSQAKADREVAALNSSAKADVVRAADKALKLAKRRISAGQRVKIWWGAHVGYDATVIGWDDQQQLKAIVDHLESAVSVPFDAVKLVA